MTSSAKPRIMMISEHADPLANPGAKETGGQNVYVQAIAKELAQRYGYSVDVFTRWDSSKKKNIVHFARHARVIRIKAGPVHYIARDELYDHLPEFLNNIVAFAADQKISYELIHAHYWMSGWLGLKLRDLWNIPLIWTAHSLGYIRYHALKGFKDIPLQQSFYDRRIATETNILQNANKIISTSPYEKRDIINLYTDKTAPVEIIPAGANHKDFYPIAKNKARAFIKKPENEIIFLYVGRIEWRKGIGTILVALKYFLDKYPQPERVSLLVVGRRRGPEAKEVARLKQNAKELGISDRVHFLGSKPRHHLKYYYSAANLTLVPSYYEPFGIVPVESFFCGCPVIASNTGGLQYTVKNNRLGLLVPPRQPKKWAEAIAKGLASEERLRSNLTNDHDYLKEFEWRNITRDIQQTYKEIIKDYAIHKEE